MRGRIGVGCAVAVVTVGVMAAPAVACGGLVGENGTIQLVRTTHARRVPRRRRALRHVVRVHRRGRGGRLDRAAARRPDQGRARRRLDAATARAGGSAAGARSGPSHAAASDAASKRRGLARDEDRRARHHHPPGGGDEVGKWALDHGFLLTPDAPEVLDFYASSQPDLHGRPLRRRAGHGPRPDAAVTARRSCSRSRPTEPWVPLRILGLGLDARQVVDADVFLLTDDQPEAARRRRGLELGPQRAASSASLLADLRSDKGMDWVPDDMWLTLPAGATHPPATSTTTSQSRRDPTSRRR